MILALVLYVLFCIIYVDLCCTYLFYPELKRHYINSLQYICEYTFSREIRHSCDSELTLVYRWVHYYSFPTEVSVFSPKYTLKEMQEQYAKITPEHVIPSEVLLKRAGDYKQAKESNKSLLPSISDMFEIQKFARISSLLKKNMPTYFQTSEMQAGVIKGDGNGIIKVPIVKTFEEEVADTRLNKTTRAKADQVIVAAVEIVNDGFASVNSDVTLAGALYDTRHRTLKNSFKGAYASRIGGAPSHVVFYPTHRVPLMDDPNETLELSLVSRDSDFEENSTLANISVRTVYAKAKGPDKIVETRNLLSAKVEDAIKAQQFASTEQVVLATPRLYPAVNLDNYTLPRGKNVVKTSGVYNDSCITFRKPIFTNAGIILNQTKSTSVDLLARKLSQKSKISEHPENSSKEPIPVLEEGLGCFSDEDEEDYKQGQAIFEDEVLEASLDMCPLSGIPETMRLLFSGSASIPHNVVEGTRITSMYLNELSTHPGVHNQLLNMLGKIPGSLRCKLFCEVAPTCGIGLAITYVEGNESTTLGNNIGRLLGIQHKKWNPAIESSVDFVFKPFSCCDWWNMHYLGVSKYSPVLTVMCLSKWLSGPKSDTRISFALYFEPDICLPKQIATIESAPSFMLRKELGVVTFPQGVRKAYQFEVNFGKPQVDKKLVTMNFASAYCGLSQYIETDVIIDLLLMSSPMMGATFTLALVSGTRYKELSNMQSLDSLPHITFNFEKGGKSGRSLKFKKELFPTRMTLDRWEIGGEKPEEVGSYFILYQRDSVSASIEGDLVVRVSARCSGNTVFSGVSVGYPTKATRSGAGKTGTRDFGMSIRKPLGYKQGQMHLNMAEFQSVYYPLAHWKYEDGKYQGSLMDGDISTHLLKMRLDGTKSSEDLHILHSPFTRILQNCAWLRGTIEWKVIILANSEIMKYRRTSQAFVTAHESSLSSYEFFGKALAESSGEIQFSREVVGVVEGFKSMGWDVQGEKKFYKLCIALGNVHEYSAVYIYGRFREDVQIAGQQKAGHYSLDKEVSLFKEISY